MQCLCSNEGFLFSVNIGQTSFEAMAQIVRMITSELEERNDQHGRNSLLTAYIQYQCTLPHYDMAHVGK